ncbi:MAG: alpha/beta hydrolase [Mesorhizobium sp.]|nr:MAG: alpha/beta hydrolase [Mesorhizobium sp.]
MQQKEVSDAENRVAGFADKLLRVKRPPIDQQFQELSNTESLTLQVEAPGDWPDGRQIEVRVHRWGFGRNALLVHGWQGRRSDLMDIGQKLVEAGYAVWLPDLPGHGDSAGERLSIPLAAAVLQAVERLAGPFAVVVGHSIGGACVVQALEQGLSTERIVLLATPTHYGHWARFMARKAGFEGDEDAILLRLERLIGLHPDRIDMRRQAAKMSQPALFIHSSDDPVVPYKGAETVASIWPGAEWLLVDGLGHQGEFLNDKVVLERVSAFVGSAPTHAETSPATAQRANL